jgi:phenylalanyl-tRNA synthetase beta chain
MQGNVRLFEIGTAFLPASGSGQVDGEEIRVGALIMGASRPPHFTEPDPPAYDAWDAKALAMRVARAAWPGAEVVLVAPDQGTEGLLWQVTVGGVVRGHVAQLVTLDAPNWAAPAYGVEITLGAMPATYVAPKGEHRYAESGASGPSVAPVRYTPLPAMPAAEFDLALLVPLVTSAATVEALIRSTAGELLESLVVFDEYRGKGLPEGTRSVGWRLTFRHPERTLRDKEIDGRRAMLLKTLETELGVVPRTA